MTATFPCSFLFPVIGCGSPHSQLLVARLRDGLKAIAAVRFGSVHLRDDPKFPKLRELPSETLMRVDTIGEAGLADLDCAWDCFFAEVKHPVHKGPVRNLFVWRCMQPIASHYRIQQRALLTHLRNRRHGQRLCDGKIIESSQFVPKLPPAIDILVRHIEDLVVRLIRNFERYCCSKENRRHAEQGAGHWCKRPAGVAAIERFLSAGWDVVGVSRRKPK